jgi:hypothetical protein
MGSAGFKLVRCAGCGHNFDAKKTGRLKCPSCHSSIWLEPPAGVAPDYPLEGSGGDTESVPSLPLVEDGPGVAASPQDAPAEHGDPSEAAAEQPGYRAEADPGAEGAPPPLEVEALKRGSRLSGAASDEVIPAWEVSGRSLFVRFGQTVAQVVTGPARFFAGLRIDGLMRSFWFGWIVCTIGVTFFSLYGLWQLDANHEAQIDALLKQSGADLTALGLSPEQVLEAMRDFMVFCLFTAPLIGAVNLWMSAGLTHLGVMLLARRNRGFKATFRATAYAFVPMLLLVVPLVGNLVGGLWVLVLQVIAVANVHRIRVGQAVLAVLLPVLSVVMVLLASSG